MNAAAVPFAESKGKRWLFWIGWAVSLWPTYVVCQSATWKLTRAPFYVKAFDQIGWPVSALTLLACLQLGSLILFLIPRTSVLGAVLLTGYLGGAIAAYVRIHYYFPVVVPLSTSMIAWLGIWLREGRLRQLLPIRFGSLRQ
ncbi:MAG TPA: DoxX family protein [Verrucomicrobiae bacterium]|nr:DoxX family protein [Verrucomicrobiae bacterium]